MDSRVKDLIDRQSQMESDRAIWEQHWREIAERVLPRQNDFITARQPEGAKRTDKIFDATACLALERSASAIDSLITPATQQWHGLEPEDPALANDREVKAYCEEVTKILFRVRYAPSANFASQTHECYIGLMAFGTLGMFVDDVVGLGIRYKSIPLVESYIAENHAGVVDYIHRKFPMTTRQAIQKFGTALPEKLRNAGEKEPFRKWDFIHCVKPNEDQKYGRMDRSGMPFLSYYVSIEEQAMLSEGGYRTMPYMFSRHVTAPRETYGRSPAMTVLPDIKMLNEMEKSFIRAAHKIISPPLLAYGDGILSAFSTRPDAINYGGVNDQGQQLVVPMKTGANLPIVREMSDQRRKVINDAFYITLFQILVENPRMTATEALIRAQEKGQLLAPTVGRQQTEFLGPMIEREIDILQFARILPPPPEKLLRSGGGLKVRYKSPLTRLQRAEDGVAIMRTVEQMVSIANAGKPEVLEVFEPMALAFEVAEINGAPAKVLRTKEDYQAVIARNAQQQQDQIDAKNAAAASVAAKNLSAASEGAGFVAPAEVPQP